MHCTDHLERHRREREKSARNKTAKRKKRNLPSKTVHCCAVAAALDTDVRCSRSYEEEAKKAGEVDSGATSAAGRSVIDGDNELGRQ